MRENKDGDDNAAAAAAGAVPVQLNPLPVYPC